MCDTVSELGVELSDDEVPGGTHWPELLSTCFQFVQSGQPALMESGLHILGNLAHYMATALKPHLTTLVQSLSACLSHTTREVQLASLRAAAYFIQVQCAGRVAKQHEINVTTEHLCSSIVAREPGRSWEAHTGHEAGL